jgi:hypothetical protein
MQDFSITSHLKYPEFFKMQFRFRYSKVWLQIVTVVGLLFFIAYVIALNFYHYDFWNTQIVCVGFMFTYFAVVFPLLSLYMIRKSFKGNLRIQEPTIYRFSEQCISCAGESFSSNYTWDKLYKIQTFSGWLLIYHNSLGYSIVKLQPEDDLNILTLKEFLKQKNYKIKICI